MLILNDTLKRECLLGVKTTLKGLVAECEAVLGVETALPITLAALGAIDAADRAMAQMGRTDG